MRHQAQSGLMQFFSSFGHSFRAAFWNLMACDGKPTRGGSYERQKADSPYRRFRVPPNSRGGGGRPRRTTAASDALTNLLAFLGRHLFPPLHHAVPPVPAVTGSASNPAEEDLAEDQDTRRLPEADQ